MVDSEHRNHSGFSLRYPIAVNESASTPSDRDSRRLSEYDSSTDETVIPFHADRSSQGFVSIASIEQFDPELSPKSSRYASRRSVDTDQCGTLYEETLDNRHSLELSERATMITSRNPRIESDVEPTEESHKEDQRLVTSATSDRNPNTSLHAGE